MGILRDSKGQPDASESSGSGERDAGGHDGLTLDDVSGINHVSDASALARDGVRSGTRRLEGIAHTLLACARHELRSPLQSIQGFAELLGSEAYGSLSEEQHAFVEHILQGSLELGSVLEACLELAELEIACNPLELARTDLRSALNDAVEHASERSGVALQTRYGNESLTAFLLIERAALRRALHALLVGLGTGANKAFRLDVVLDGAQARLTIGLPGRVGAAPALSIEEFARRRRATRSLIWLRLAAELLALQEGVLLVTEQLDCVEVRLTLSSPH